VDCLCSEDTMANASELTALHATLKERLDNQITFFRMACAVAAVWLGAISLALYDMNGKLGTLALPQRLSKTAEAPTNPKNQTEATTALAAIRREAIPVPASVISDAAKRFVDASPKDTGAWRVALDFTAYRSSLNIVNLPNPSSQIEVPVTTHYFLPHVPDRPQLESVMWIGPIVPASAAAHLELIGQDQNVNLPAGPSALQLTGGATSLDGMRIKQVIFYGVEVLLWEAPDSRECGFHQL
jgi:hypothetical protein